jgi:hypothetical protein
VRLEGGGLAGQIEGVVSSLGVLYTTFSDGEDQIMVPNNVVLSVAVVPLHEPATPMRDKPRVALEEIDGDETVVRIGVPPAHPHEGARLSSEVLHALANETRRAEAA